MIAQVDLLVFGAHPDDIEFGCGGVVVGEVRRGSVVHLVVCSSGESGTYGTPEQRRGEAQQAAAIAGATLEFLELGGDAHFQPGLTSALKVADLIRKLRPHTLLAPSLVKNQHPDHAILGELVRDAARLARYGGVAELRERARHSVEQLFYYALSPPAEPRDISPLLVDVSDCVEVWTQAMLAHASQTGAREYVEMQLTRARLLGLSAGVGHAIALFPNDPPLLTSLAQVSRASRRF